MNPRQLRMRYANVYLKEWGPLYQSKTSTQPIESQQETPAMAARGQSFVDSLGGCQNHKRNASRVDPSVVGLFEDASLSAVRIFDHLTPRMQKVLLEAKRFKEQFHYQYCWSKGSQRLCTFAKMPRLEPLRDDDADGNDDATKQ